MAAKKSSKVSKPKSSKAPAKRKGSPKVQNQQASGFSDLEGFLVKGISKHSNSPKSASHILSELLYNITPSMRGLGYLSGFRAGLKLSSSHNPTNTIHPLVAALENAGFSRILYHPDKHSVVIRAHHHPDCESGAKKQVHVFEAGLIAGYLTESTHMTLRAIENRCVHEGGSVCQFLAERDVEMGQVSAFEGMDEMIDALILAIGRRKIDSRISDGYFALQMLPLTKGPINSELSKLFYVIGERVASKTPKITEHTAQNLCALFGLRKIKLEKGRRGISGISATFAQSNSLSGYAELVSSFLSGMLYQKYGKVASTERRLGADGSYTLEVAI
ncbi:MAG: 4-vinyl reductase [Candidatus Micrarchaeota archaeon]|nr:4-vinyl reductase [Candidatus Micrarchaeota archaeon]